MKICSKCKIEKGADQYYTYYHSTLKKHYTRGVCQECMKVQAKQVKLRIKERKARLKQERIEMIEVLAEQNKVPTIVPNELIEDFSTNPDYKSCTACQKYKPLSAFYQNKNTLYYHSRCKDCHRDYSNGKLIDYYQEKYRTKGGSERILPKAGTFVDIYQEEQVTWLLQLIGWRKENEVWVKEGIKKVVDGKIVWDKILTKEKKKKERPKHPRVYDVERIVQLRNSGLLLREIGFIMKISRQTIKKILIKADEEKRNG
jgi:hypothetical protein